MPANKIVAALNQLFEIENRSLATYLADACPWTHPGDQKAAEALSHIIADQQVMAGRIAELIDARGGCPANGSFPMEFTELNLLSLDFLLREVVRHQKQAMADIERLVRVVAFDREARDLVEEVLGSEQAHLEALEELARQPA